MARRELTMHQACLAHARADRALRLMVSKQLDDFHLSMMEWLLLGAISQSPPGGVSMGDAAKALEVTMPHVTSLMNNLVLSDWVRQKTATKDRRSRRLLLTPKGKELLAEIEQVIAQKMRERLADLPKKQLEHYLETVQYLAQSEAATSPEA